MTPDRFIMTEKDREEWKEGLEHADATKAFRAPVPMLIPEPRQQPVLIPYKVEEARKKEEHADRMKALRKEEEIFRKEEERKRRSEEHIAFLLKKYGIDTKKVDEK